MIGGDVVLSFADGYLEEVLVNRLSPELDALIENRLGMASPLTVAALRCIRRCWLFASALPSLKRALHTHEARSVQTEGTSSIPTETDDAWTVMDDQIQVTWITV